MRFEADDQLLRWKKITPAQAAKAKRWAGTARDRDIKSKRPTIG